MERCAEGASRTLTKGTGRVNCRDWRSRTGFRDAGFVVAQACASPAARCEYMTGARSNGTASERQAPAGMMAASVGHAGRGPRWV